MTGYTREDAKNAVGPGWALLVDRVFDVIEKHNGNEMQQAMNAAVLGVVPITVTQVKEKFGGLRIYTFDGAACPGIGEIYAVIDAAEAESVRTCEQCGAPGRPGGTGWIKTACEQHR